MFDILGAVAVWQEKQQNLERQRKQTEGNLDHTVKQVERLQGDVAAAARRYTYIQDTRAFIADMCDMLQVRRIVFLATCICSSSSSSSPRAGLSVHTHASGTRAVGAVE